MMGLFSVVRGYSYRCEHQRESGGDQEQEETQLEAVERLLQKQGPVHLNLSLLSTGIEVQEG